MSRSDFMKTSLLTAGGLLCAPNLNASTVETKRSSQETLLENYRKCLGGPLPERIPLNPQYRETIKKDSYRIESLTYEAQEGDKIPALLLIPDKVTASDPAPGIAVWHQHAGEFHLGKSEPAGLAGNPMHHTGVALVKEGYVVLCPDTLCFEERQDPTGKMGGNKAKRYERFEFVKQVIRGRSLAWKNILDMRAAIDYLEGREEVISDRMGCYGHSMGSILGWQIGPVEPRLKCIVGNCCLPPYEGIEEAHVVHCFTTYIPNWLQYGDIPEIASLIAPRPFHLNFGEQDEINPISSVKRGLKRIEKVYEDAGASDNFSYYIEPGSGHILSEEMWLHAKNTFEKHLKNG